LMIRCIIVGDVADEEEMDEVDRLELEFKLDR
jgi:hypothetical protein